MRKALVIGIDNYPYDPLEGCVNDAVCVASLLKKNEDGSPNFDVRLITNPSDRQDIPTTRRLIDELFETHSDVALFYYAGHGLLKSTGGYIITSDFKTHNEEIFSKFKIDEEGNYYNERLETEINKRKAYSESRRNNLKS